MSEQRPVATGIMTPEQLGVGQAQTNPLGMINTMSEVMLRNQEMQMHGLEIAGRNRFGEIMGTGTGTFEEKYQQALSDPVASAWATQNYGTVRQGILAMIQAHGEVMKQATSGWDAVGQVMPAIMNNPNMTREDSQRLINQKLGMLSPEALERVGPQISSFQNWVWDGNPTFQERQQRIASALGTFGMSPADARDWTGTPAPGFRVEPLGPGGAPTAIGYGGPPGAGLNVRQLDTGPAPSAPTPGPVAAAPPPAPGTTQLPQVGVTAPAAPRTGGLTGITPQQKAEQEAVGGRAKDVEESIAETTRNLPSLQKNLDTMQASLGRFMAGGGAATRADLARALQAFGNTVGMNPTDVQNGVDGIMGGKGALSAYDVFNSYIRSFAVERLKNAAQGTGRVMRSEVDAFMTALDATRDPAALMQLINTQGRFLLQKGYDIAAKYPQFKAGLRAGTADTQGYDISSFDNYYANQYDERRLPTKTPRGQYIGPWPLTVTSDEDRDSLPEGGQYITPDDPRPRIKGGR